MSDPAVEAAYRYRERRYPEADGLVGAAREALVPVQEWYQKQFAEDGWALDCGDTGSVVRQILAELAPLIYPDA